LVDRAMTDSTTPLVVKTPLRWSDHSLNCGSFRLNPAPASASHDVKDMRLTTATS
jgi:hypothetical protein